MTEEIFRNIYRIPVPLPGNPLKELNAYLIRGKDESFLIDTGFRQDPCRAALQSGLDELGVRREEITVLLTHLHSDHSGLAPEFAGEGHHILVSEADRIKLDGYNKGDRISWKESNELFTAAGFPLELIRSIDKSNPARSMAPPDTDNYTSLQDGQVLECGGYKLRCILVPGHTPGQMCFWMEEQGAMFTGDHVLFDISPNIIAWERVDDSLGDYLDSLRLIRQYDVRSPLPAHRRPGNMKERVDALIEHHGHRLEEACCAVRDHPGLDAFNLAGYMTWKIRANSWEEFPITQKWFAVGECVAHLDYLRVRGRVRRERDENGVYRYFAE